MNLRCYIQMVYNVEYDDGIMVFIVLGIIWSFSFELAVIVGLCWAIAGISKSNSLKEHYYESE